MQKTLDLLDSCTGDFPSYKNLQNFCAGTAQIQDLHQVLQIRRRQGTRLRLSRPDLAEPRGWHSQAQKAILRQNSVRKRVRRTRRLRPDSRPGQCGYAVHCGWRDVIE